MEIEEDTSSYAAKTALKLTPFKKKAPAKEISQTKDNQEFTQLHFTIDLNRAMKSVSNYEARMMKALFSENDTRLGSNFKSYYLLPNY